MRTLILTILLSSCGAIKAEQTTTYRVEGDATVHILVGVDVTPCMTLPADQQEACIAALVDLAEKLGAASGSTTTQDVINE